MLATIPHDQFPALSGADIKKIMTNNKVTISCFAEANDITKARVRQLRISGVPAGFRSWEIYKMAETAASYR